MTPGYLVLLMQKVASIAHSSVIQLHIHLISSAQLGEINLPVLTHITTLIGGVVRPHS